MTKVITRAKLAEFDNWAKARDNLYYGYGEFFEPDPKFSTDCSGLVMSTAAFFQGMNPYQRYGSTESFRLDYKIVYDLGFKRGAGGPEHFFKVGLFHGGGGPNSHTACTVDGVAWESSGGNGVQYGPPGRHWNDRMFDDFWHYDGVLESNDLLDELVKNPLIVAGFAQLAVPHVSGGLV